MYWDGASTRKYAVSGVAVGTYQITNGIHYWSSPASGTAGNTATVSANMTLDASGNLGIGTSPDALLHVKHAGGGFDEVARLTAIANSAGDGAFLGFHGNSTSKFYGFIGGYDIDTNKGGVKIGVGNGETAIADSMTKMTIDNDGNVGIVGDPTNLLQVFGGSVDSRIQFTNNTSGTGYADGFWVGMDNNRAYLLKRENQPISFFTNASLKLEINADGHLIPYANNSFDLGSTANRWRNIYTNDLNLSNEGSGGNDIDGSEGNWTIQEGETDLFIINNKNGKKYKFALEELK